MDKTGSAVASALAYKRTRVPGNLLNSVYDTAL
jgi:hypothetical protein